MGTRGQALGLYRRILRAARTWPGPQEEVEYIRVSHKACLSSISPSSNEPFPHHVSAGGASGLHLCLMHCNGTSINSAHEHDVGLD